MDNNRLRGYDAPAPGVHPAVPVITLVTGGITFALILGANPHPDGSSLLVSTAVGLLFGFFTWLLTR